MNNVLYEVSKNEFINDDARLGLFRTDIEPYKFVTLDKSSQIISPSTNFINLLIRLSDNKYTSERKFYTVLTLIGDLGGFNGAIIILPAYIMSKYSEKMYTADIMEEIPVSKTKKSD